MSGQDLMDEDFGSSSPGDFVRLGSSPHSIHEQPDLEDRENLASAAAAATTKLASKYDDDDEEDDDEFPRNAGGFSSSTDRPLVTPPSPQPIPTAETTGEIRLTPDLTPDPEEKAQEPFVNVTAGGHVGGFQEEEDEEDEDEVRDLGHQQPIVPDKYPAWETQSSNVHHSDSPSPAYQFESDDLDPTEDHYQREDHFSAPSAPEPSLFDPVPSHHQLLDDNFEDYSRPLHHQTAAYDEPTPKAPSPAPAADLLNLGDFMSTTTTTTSQVTVESSVHRSASDFYEPEVEVEPPKTKSQPASQPIPEYIPEPQRLETISQHQSFVSDRPAKMEDSEDQNECTFHPRAWLNPSKLDPRVGDLVYWRDLKRSGIAFGSGLVVLLSLTYFSLISVVAYVLLAVMTGTLSYRIYKNVLQAVQKSNDGHPFKEYLDVDLTLPSDKVRDGAEVFVKHLECTASRLRQLFLVEDLVDSIKFAVLLWVLTYVGACFNGLTLFTLGFISLFTIPKIYETYKAQIDFYLNMVCGQVSEVMNKIKAKIPIGKKPKQQ